MPAAACLSATCSAACSSKSLSPSATAVLYSFRCCLYPGPGPEELVLIDCTPGDITGGGCSGVIVISGIALGAAAGPAGAGGAATAAAGSAGGGAGAAGGVNPISPVAACLSQAAL